MENKIIGMCNGCREPFGNCMCKDKVDSEQFWIHDYMAVDLFPKQPTWTEVFNNLTIDIMQLDKYNSEICDRMDLWENGIYVKLEDVLNIFAEKTLNKP